MTRHSRRELLYVVAVVAIFSASCKKKTSAPPRCTFCGMKIDPSSAWRAEIVDGRTTTPFDSPKCALLYLRGPHDPPLPANTVIRLQEFYSREWRSAADVTFVLGSDVLGPMGNDAVPVDRARVAQFVHDHASGRVPRERDLSALTVEELRAL